jgi:hypothetical protein
MAELVQIPVELAHFQLPDGVQERLTSLLDRQDAGEGLTQAERQEAEGLVELADDENTCCFTTIKCTNKDMILLLSAIA